MPQKPFAEVVLGVLDKRDDFHRVFENLDAPPLEQLMAELEAACLRVAARHAAWPSILS